MSTHFRDDDPLSATDGGEWIETASPANETPSGGSPGGSRQPDLYPIDRFERTADEFLHEREQVREKLEQALADAKADEEAIFQNLISTTKTQAGAEGRLSAATVELTHVGVARREIGGVVAVVLGLAIGLGEWSIDRNVLLSAFPLLSRLTVSGLALIAVAGSMFSAILAGSASKDIDHEITAGMSNTAMTDRRNRALGTVTGVTIEVVLALIRAVRTGAVLTSILLAAAGLALWAFARWLAYRHRSKERTHHDRAADDERKARATATADRKREVQVHARHTLTHRKLIETAKGVIGHLNREAHGAKVLWQRANPATPFPGVTKPAALEVWEKYAKGWLPDELRIPTRELPSIDTALTPGWYRGTPPRELGSGGSR